MTLDAAAGLLACPTCAQPLDVARSPATCPAGHAFDVARQGYLNLLGAKPPANADTADMVAARDRFLASGAYDGIADAAARELGGASGSWLEVGAGTGFYLSRALEADPASRGVALDVSVYAARRAARAHPRLASVVADVWKPLPLQTGVLTGVLCVFAPRNLPEFARVLAPGGSLVVVTPAPDHLAALRARHGLLGIEDGKNDRLLDAVAGLFEPVTRTHVAYGVDAHADQVRDLIGMGPNAFHGVPRDPGPARLAVSVGVHRFLRTG